MINPARTGAIVAGMDGSDRDIPIARYALELATTHHTQLVLAHAWSLPWEAGYFTADDVSRVQCEATQMLDAVGRAVGAPAAVDLVCVVDEGPAIAMLTRLAASAGAVVVGRHRDWLTRLLDNDAASHLAGRMECPLVVVPDNWTTPSAREADVVVAVDGDTRATAALGFAFAQADLTGRRLVVLHAVSSSDPDVQATETRDIGEICAGWQEQNPSVTFTRRLVTTDPTASIIEASAAAALMIVGTPHDSRHRRLSRASVAHQALASTCCPIAIVHSLSGPPTRTRSSAGPDAVPVPTY